MVNVARSKTSRGEGLVPRWGRGVARQNPPCQTTTRAFFIPRCARAGRPASTQPRHSRVDGNPRTIATRQYVNRRIGNNYCGQCTAVEDFARRGACPPLGSGRGAADPTVPNHNSCFFIPRYAGAGRHPDLVILAKARIHAQLTLGNTSMEKPGTTTVVNVALGLVPSFGSAASSR